MPPVRSNIWHMFIKTNLGGKCKLCHCEVKTAGNTTNLKKHLQRRHPNFSQDGDQGNSKDPLQTNKPVNDSLNDTVLDNMENRSNDFVDSSLSIASTSTASIVSVDLTNEAEAVSLCQNNKLLPKSSRQSSINEAFSTIKSFSDGGTKAGKITNAITFLIAKDYMPLNTTEKEGFRHLMKVVAPLYQIPNRGKMGNLIDEKYTVLSGMFKQKLKELSSLTLTTDVWTETMSTKSFLGVTSHFLINKKLTSLTIGVFELHERHNAEYLGQCLTTICEEWNIDILKVTAVVTDNGANIVKAVTDVFGKNKHLPCFAHTLDLVASKISDDIEPIKNIISKVKSIVTYFKQSVIIADDLRKAQPPDNILKLIQCVPTRWNSKFYMLKRFCLLYEYIAPILLKHPKSPAMVDASDLATIGEVLTVLSPIEAVSRELCGEQYLTSSKVIPVVNCLLKKIEKLTPTTQEVVTLKATTLQELSKRFAPIEQNKLLAVSTILDPRFKRLHFNHPMYCANAVTYINQSVYVRKQQNIDEPQKSQTENPDSVWAYHNELAIKNTGSHDVSRDDFDLYLKMYLNTPTLPLDSDPFVYWDSIESPALKELANKFLSIVGTSVPSERLFSKAGNIITQSRNRLGGKRLSKLLFLSSLNTEDWNL